MNGKTNSSGIPLLSTQRLALSHRKEFRQECSHCFVCQDCVKIRVGLQFSGGKEGISVDDML